MPYCPECSAAVPEGAAKCPTCGSSLISTPSAHDTGGEPQPLDTDRMREELASSLAPQYQLLKLLGSGGMGAVFLAREPALRRLVAVKVLSPILASEPKARARFEREARAAAALSHPNVVRVYAVGQTDAGKLPYIIMQYVEGVTLSHWMSQRKRVSERDARRIIGDVAAALAAAHTRELVHRDVKPSNVLIETESGRAFVADFGVSAALSPGDQGTTKLTVTGTVVGTPAYMSPEQAAGEPVTPKSDIYSLGLVAYELLTGALPYTATTAMGWAAAHLRDPVTPLTTRRPDVAPEVGRIIDRCLAKQPALRPEAEDVARTMMPSLESEVPWPPPGLAWLHGRGRVLARLSLFAAVGGLLTVFALAFTPRILQVHSFWLARFAATSTTAPTGLSAFRADPAATSQFVWQTVLIIGLAGFAASLAAMITVAIQATAFTLARRRRGWGWAILVDVAADPDGRSGLALMGAREFASLDPVNRKAVLAARRVQTAVEMAAGPWVALVGALWTIAILTGLLSNRATANLMNTTAWLAAALPVLACLMASAAARLLERRRTGELVRRPRFEESDADIAAWYASAPEAPRPSPAAHPPRRLLVLGSEGLAALAIAVVVVALAAGGLAALVAVIATSRLGPPAAQLTAAIASLDRQDPLGTTRQLVAGILPPEDSASDSLTAVSLRRLILPPSGADALPDYTPVPTALQSALQGTLSGRFRMGSRLGIDQALGSPSRDVRLPPALSTSEAMRRALARRIPADTIRLLREVGAHPRTALFRQLARANHWDLSDGFTPLGRIGEAALANLLGAIGEVAQGDMAAARRRLGENAAASLRLLQVPTPAANELGRNILGSFALMPLAELVQLQGDGRQAAELREGAQRLLLLGLLTTYGLGGLAADPANLEPVVSYLRDARLPLGWRATLMTRVVWGACTNPREVLLGASPARRAAVLGAAPEIAGAPHAERLTRMATEYWRTDLAAAAMEGTTPWPFGFLLRVASCLVPG
jgi:hypothetical protein